MGSGSERLVSSDVGERRRDCDSSILGFGGSETEHEKLASAMLIGDRIRAALRVLYSYWHSLTPVLWGRILRRRRFRMNDVVSFD